MCGRYFVDQELADLLSSLNQAWPAPAKAGDIHPAENALVWKLENNRAVLRQMAWGFLKGPGKELLINCRAETALDRHTFRESVLARRCVIPASGFYEWDRAKNKVTFRGLGKSFLYMGGIYDRFGDELRFTVLTTAADQTVSKVHDRMPLVLERKEAMEWLSAGCQEKVKDILSMKASAVKIVDGFVQETFPFL